MGITWDYEALDDLESILYYIETCFSMKEAQNFRQKVVHVTRNLSEFPYLGKVEPLLEDCADMELRSITVDKLCKLIYLIMPDTIFIVAVWDTRRNPENLEQDVRGRFH